MKKITLALACALALMLCGGHARAAQGSGCMPTTGTVSGLTLVQDINAGIAALISTNSGATAPATDCTAVAVAGQLWLDTTSATLPILKIYTGSAWVRIGTVDVSNGRWLPPVGGGSNTLASASTANLCTSTDSYLSITGTTTITSFGSSCVVGQSKDITFTGVLTLTYNASSMILPSGASITTAAGDYARAVYLGSGNWAVVGYTRASGFALASSSVFTGAVVFGSTITPTTLAANTNNWAPTGQSTANVIRAQASSSVNLTGLTAAAADGQRVLLRNVGASNTITLVAESGSSTAANRFKLLANVPLAPGSAIDLAYDTSSARWVAATTTQLNTFTGDSGAGGVAGQVPAPSAGDNAAGKFLKAGGSFTTPPSFVGDSGSGGTAGYVPAPGAGDAAAGKYLGAGGTFSVPPSGSTNVQTFSTAGGPFTWTKPATGSVAYITCWGGGGSGGKGQASGPAGGGGGGGFNDNFGRLIALSLLGATENVTIGAGGAAQTTGNTDGNTGGTSSFGAWVLAYGGGGGSTNNGGGGGGGGGGATSAGGTSGSTLGGSGGSPDGATGGQGSAVITGTPGLASTLGGGGGGGGFDAAGTGVNKGGNSTFAGGGGGGAANSVAGGTAGISIYAGSGSAGAFDANASSDGVQPGGGSGGTEGGNSGKGGDGKCIAYVW